MNSKSNIGNARFIDVDCCDRPIGRVAVSIVHYLLNKDVLHTKDAKRDTYITVRNYNLIKIKEGNKRFKHSGHYGNGEWVTHSTIYERDPDSLIRLVVRRMLPKSKRCSLIKHIFTDEQTKHKFLQKKDGAS